MSAFHPITAEPVRGQRKPPLVRGYVIDGTSGDGTRVSDPAQHKYASKADAETDCAEYNRRAAIAYRARKVPLYYLWGQWTYVVREVSTSALDLKRGTVLAPVRPRTADDAARVMRRVAP
jgi:hypothetical protein